jgi:phytoene dehydrogenase-like protein
VVSGVDPKQTFLKLLPDLPVFDSLKERVRRLDFSSASMKVNIALSSLPSFRCLPGTLPGPQHRGTIHISPTINYILRALEEAKSGVPSTEPILEITIPSVLDDTIAPAGKHLMNIFVQFTPYHLKSGSWDSYKQIYFRDHIMPVMRRYIENIDSIIEGVEILSPLDLERRFGLTEGNIFHGAMKFSQLFMFRPLLGLSGYSTPVKGLFLCGAGTHPGGGVMGICGFNAAREIIANYRQK